MDDGLESQEPINFQEFRKAKAKQEKSLQTNTEQLPSEKFSEFLWKKLENLSPEEIIPQLDIISNRFASEIEKADEENPESVITAHNIGLATGEIFKWLSSTDSNIKVKPEILDRLYKLVDTKSPMMQYYVEEFIYPLVILDNRNGDASTGLLKKFTDDLVRHLAKPQTETEPDTAKMLLNVANEYCPQRLGDFLVIALQNAPDDEALKRAVVEFSNIMGYNEARGTILNYSQGNDKFELVLKRTERATGLQMKPDTVIHSTTDTLYGNMNEDTYNPYNELAEFEVKLLEEKTKPDEEIIDLGAGTGRTMIPLSQTRLVSGIDITDAYVRMLNEMGLDVRLESWNRIHRGDGELDAAYSFGRSTLHNSSIPEWLSMLKELKRVLKDSGRFFLDIPNVDSMHYGSHIEGLKEKLEKLGIRRISRGSIIDSPDGKNYVDRLAPSPEQMEAMANLAGFDARQIASKDYSDDEGNPVTNTYWELKKTSRALTSEEAAGALRVAYGIDDEIDQSIQQVA